MSTDPESARQVLGARLRELRAEAGLDGKDLATRLGWQPSKVSRLQSGKQAATREDVAAWAAACDRPDAARDLHGLLAGLGVLGRHRPWRRQLAGGHRGRQEVAVQQTVKTSLTRAMETTRVPGLLQTPGYAAAGFDAAAAFRDIPPTTADAVDARMRRQEALHDPAKRFEFLISEAALHARVCSVDAMAEQLDRLFTLTARSRLRLGLLPFSARLPRSIPHGFWIYDRRTVVVETLGEELWLESPDDVALYERAWEWLSAEAVEGAGARQLIGRARAALGTG